MPTEPCSEKKTIAEITPEQTMVLRSVANILIQLEGTIPKAQPIEIKRAPVLQMILANVEEQEQVRSVEPEKILRLTRAERPVTFNVASLTRINANDEGARPGYEMGNELDTREDAGAMSEGEEDLFEAFEEDE
jgi:hypothetical protein